MAQAHELILTAGLLCLLAIAAGRLSLRAGSPLLLAFILLGMLAGEDGPGQIVFGDFKAAYFTGSLALTAILFGGGLGTGRGMLRAAFWPALALATLGVAFSAGIVAVAAHFLLALAWPDALLAGAVTAPTDAAAVQVLLRQSRIAVPERVVAALEVESGLNDPMSVFLTVALTTYLTAPHGMGAAQAAELLAIEAGGGVAFGLAGGFALLFLFRHLRFERTAAPVLAVGGALAIFGGAQMLECSGFLAVYLAGLVLANHEHPAAKPVTRFFETLGWLAQIVLFLMLGLLVTPHDLPDVLPAALLLCAVLVLVARPLAVAASLVPFRWRMKETGFIAWAGLRGAVPIYLTIIPLLHGVRSGETLFDIVFVVVIVSVAVQGWTVGPLARFARGRRFGLF